MHGSILMAVLLLSSAALAAPAGEPLPAAPTTSELAPVDAPVAPVASPPVETTSRTEAPAERGVGLSVALKTGGLFPQLFSNLGVAATLQLELGALLWQRRVAVFAAVGYAQPSTRGTLSDGRITGAPADWDVTVRQLDVAVGAAYRFPLGRLTPYAGAAFRIQMQEVISDGSAGANGMGEHRQTATAAGGMLLGGADLKLGPGALLAELQAGYAPIDRSITGASNTGSVGLLLGYRLTF